MPSTPKQLLKETNKKLKQNFDTVIRDLEMIFSDFDIDTDYHLPQLTQNVLNIPRPKDIRRILNRDIKFLKDMKEIANRGFTIDLSD